MSEEFFRGRPVMGVVDPDLYFFWNLVHVLHDSLGSCHPVLAIPSLVKPWLEFVNAVDEAFATSFFLDGGAAGCDVVFYFGDN